MTVEEVLRQSGFTNEQITALEPRAITAFTNVLTEAQQAREAAEVAKRANEQFYENQIGPSLVNWEAEKTRLDNEKAQVMAENAFYKAQAEQARSSGFIPADVPGFNGQPRDQQGRYVAGAPGATPGSPQFFDVNKMYERAGDAISIISDISWEHESLFGQKLPISPSELIRQADAHKLDPRTYAARSFDWDKRRQEIEEKRRQEHDDKIRKEAVAENDRRWAERTGSNPDIRQPQHNPKYAEIQRAVRRGDRPDPIMMNESERRNATRSAIREDVNNEERAS
jgi:hypothetical protein